MEAMWRKMSGTNDITNRLTAFVHVISCTCGGPVNTSVPVSDHERLLSIIRSLSQCKKVSAVGIREKIKLLTQQEVEKICAHRTATDN